MPIYEYKCQHCHAVFEAIRSFSQADTPIRCKNCGLEDCNRMISRFNAHGESINSSSRGSCGSCSSHSCGTCACH